MYNQDVESSSHIVVSYAQVGSYVTNAIDYNYKLRSMIEQEHNFTANKWTWFDTQVCVTFLWSWVISRALVDYTDMGRFIGCILEDVQAPYVSMNNSIKTITLYFHTSMVVHPESNDHLWIRNLIHGNMFSSSLKKQRKGKISLKNGIIGIDCKMTIDTLMKH